MANRIKGITVEINGDTTKLSKALQGVDTFTIPESDFLFGSYLLTTQNLSKKIPPDALKF